MESVQEAVKSLGRLSGVLQDWPPGEPEVQQWLAEAVVREPELAQNLSWMPSSEAWEVVELLRGKSLPETRLVEILRGAHALQLTEGEASCRRRVELYLESANIPEIRVGETWVDVAGVTVKRHQPEGVPET